MSFADKTYIVTGAGSGIGRATALLLAQQGANVAICDVNKVGCEETHQQILKSHGKVLSALIDVTRGEDFKSFVSATVQKFGALHGAFNNAGIGGGIKPISEMDEALWDLVMNVNVKSVWLCMKEEFAHMKQGASIVNMSSVAGIMGFRHNALYSASKHAVIGLTKSAAISYARLGIRVNAICPGYTDTPMVDEIRKNSGTMIDNMIRAVPMRRLGEPDEIAEGVLFLLSDKSSFMTGHSLVVDGGITLE